MGIRQLRSLVLVGLCLTGLFGCATVPDVAPEPGTAARPADAGAGWAVLGIDEVKRIAAIREELNELHLAFRDVTIIRMMTGTASGEEKRVEVTSIGPTIVGAQKDGAPAARTTFALTKDRERLVLFTQDVPNRKAFHREIPAAELVAGKNFRFPVVQESGRILEQTFTVQQIILR